MENLKRLSPYRLSSLLRLQPNPNLALQLFQSPNSSPKPFRYSRLSYDLIISKLGRAKMFDQMEQIIDQMRLETRFSPKEVLFCNVISFYGRSRMSEPAQRIYDRIPSFNCQRTAMFILGSDVGGFSPLVPSLSRAVLHKSPFPRQLEIGIMMGIPSRRSIAHTLVTLHATTGFMSHLSHKAQANSSGFIFIFDALILDICNIFPGKNKCSLMKSAHNKK